jgi:hypothetical protein
MNRISQPVACKHEILRHIQNEYSQRIPQERIYLTWSLLHSRKKKNHSNAILEPTTVLAVQAGLLG